MKKSILILPVFATFLSLAQQHEIKLTHTETGKTVLLREGNKVIMAVRQAKHDIKKKPSNVYSLSKSELADSIFIFTKGRIISITDTSIILKERNSLFSASTREIKIDKINTLRKLSMGNQLFRTAATVAGSIALGIAVFYSYAAVGGGEGFVSGMFYAAGTFAILSRFGRTKIANNPLNKWEISK